jgi:hypothetical protein
MKGFSQHLFWDTDRDQVSLDTHQVWLAKRVLEKGGWTDWLLLLRLLGKDQVREAVRGIRCLEKKALSFACVALDLDKTKLRCYTPTHYQSTHWNY